MQQILRKNITIIVSIVILVLAFWLSRTLINSKKPQQEQRKKITPLAYVHAVKNKNLSVQIPASGLLRAKNKIQIISEVQGVLNYAPKEFKPGVRYQAGEVLYSLNSDEFYSNILAQRSSFLNQLVSLMPDLKLDFQDDYQLWSSYLETYDIENAVAVLPKPQSEKVKLFIAAKNIYSSYYAIKNLEIKLEKYKIRAPFDGVLTVANITPGTLVNPGQSMGEFVDPGVYELEVSVNSSLIDKLKVGDVVSVDYPSQNVKSYKGKIVRINEKVDVGSQTVNVFVELTGNGLREGMFLKAHLPSQIFEQVIEIPNTLLLKGQSVFVVKDSILTVKAVQPVHQGAQKVLIRGLKDGELILSKPLSKAFDGMKVDVIVD